MRIFQAIAAFFRILFSAAYARRVAELTARPALPEPIDAEVEPLAERLAADGAALEREAAEAEEQARRERDEAVAKLEREHDEALAAAREKAAADCARAEAELAAARAEAEAQARAAVEGARAAGRERDAECALRTTAVVLGLLQREGRLIDFLREDIAAFDDAQVGAAVRPVHEGCRKTLEEYVTLEAVRPEAEGARVTVPPGFDASAIRLSGNVRGNPPFKGILRHHGWRVSKLNLPDRPAAHASDVVAPADVELV